MPTDPKGEEGLREAAKALLGMRQSITTDVGSAHSLRGNDASEWMREDDREMRKELREAFDRLEAALARAPSALTEAAKGAREKALERAFDGLQGAISWVEPPFVDERTSREELWQRVGFLLADRKNALKALAEVEGERS